MGQTLPAGKEDRVISFELSTSLPRCTIEIIRNNEVIKTHPVDQPFTSLEYVDDVDPGDLWIRNSPKNPGPFFYYYVRVMFSGVYHGISAWSSPIWIEEKG